MKFTFSLIDDGVSVARPRVQRKFENNSSPVVIFGGDENLGLPPYFVTNRSRESERNAIPAETRHGQAEATRDRNDSRTPRNDAP